MKTQLEPSKLYWASFNRFELRLPGEAINDIAQQGANDEAVAYWTPKVIEQCERDAFPNRLTDEAIAIELKEYGAWDSEELQDTAQNWRRLVWIAAWNIAEDESPDCSEPVK